MKRLLAATTIALSLLAGSVALADDNGRFGNGRGSLPGDYRGDRGRGDQGGSQWRGGDRGRGDHGGNNWRGSDHRFDHDRNNWRDGRRYDDHGRNNWRDDHRYNDHRFDRGRDWHDGRRDFHYDGRHDRGYDHRYNDRHYYGPRYDGRYYGRYRLGPYHRPYGYYDHYWRRGDRLPRGYYAPRYIVGDYYSYGLRRPPRDCHWVRVNNDVVLAAITTGIVLDIAYNHFY